jgi:hypothetical protein
MYQNKTHVVQANNGCVQRGEYECSTGRYIKLLLSITDKNLISQNTTTLRPQESVCLKERHVSIYDWSFSSSRQFCTTGTEEDNVQEEV